MHKSVICALGTAGSVCRKSIFRRDVLPFQDGRSFPRMHPLKLMMPSSARFGVGGQDQESYSILCCRPELHSSKLLDIVDELTRHHTDNPARKLPPKDLRKFWTEIKHTTGQVPARLAASIGPETSPPAIAELWRGNYQSFF